MFNKLFALGALFMTGSQSIGNSRDSSSYANIDEVITEHISLDFAVDFDTKTFDGHVTLNMKTIAAGVESVFLDSAGLDVHEVQYQRIHSGKASWEKVNFDVTTPNEFLGSPVEVHLIAAQNLGEQFKLKLYYTTNENSTAINWLSPSQTAGKVLPYLFTQCEDIACRSVAPMQDTPAIKVTYDSKVKVTNDFVVKMSANETKVEQVDDDHKVYHFKNDIKIASYLIAIAVGDLEYRSLGPNTGVITEPSFMDQCAEELENLQVMLDTAQSYLTPYIWGNYTILVLPPSFPMGGMENILLTFASPTIITGDKSQVDVATHEIAHSWTGNDVTTENWSNMWLNEGFTVFEERKVSAQLHGEDFSKVAAYLGNISYVSDMLDYGLDSNYSSLFPQVGSNLPDDAFSTVPYEKGFQLLYHMESLIGDDNMQTLLRGWIDEYKQQSVNYTMFGDYFTMFLANNYDEATAAQIATDMHYVEWVTAPGLPPVTLDFTTADLNQSSALADDYIFLGGASSPANYTEFDDYYSSLQVVFIERLKARIDDVNLAILEKIDVDLTVTGTLDPEVKERWFPLGIRKNYQPVFDQAHTFISSMGRLKYLTPVYQALLDANRCDLATSWFDENKDFYHPMAVLKIQKLIAPCTEESPEALFMQ